MQYNNKDNHTLANELDDVILNITDVCKKEPLEAVVGLENQLKRIDTISQELKTPELRALSHWILLNLEFDENSEEQFIELTKSDSFIHWISILSSLLRKYDQLQLPELYNSLVNPNWLTKPSIPVLKTFAKWIDATKVDSSINVIPSVKVAAETLETSDTNDDFKNDSETLSPITETEQKHVFEEIPSSILEKDYQTNDESILKEFTSSEDDSQALLITEKTSTYYDDLELDEHQELLSNNIDLADISDFPEDILTDDLSNSNPLEKYNVSEESILDNNTNIEKKPSEAIAYKETNTGTLLSSINIETEDEKEKIVITIDNNDISNDSLVNSLIENNEDSTELIESNEALELGNEFTLEVDDIVMNLATISSTSTDIFSETEKMISELERLDSLSELFSYTDIPKVSVWCQSNIRLFKKNQTDSIKDFMTSGECWSWIELTNAYLSDPEELTHLSLLSTELTREEWLEPLEIENLQNLLLFLRNPEKSSDESSSIEDLPKESNKLPDSNNQDNIHDNKVAKESKIKLSWDEDTHPELLAAFFEETGGLIKEASQLLKKVSDKNANKDERSHASRIAHTIKGGSAVVGITGLADYAYQLEKILDHSVNHELSAEASTLLIEASSSLENVFEAVINKGTEPNEFASVLAKLVSYADSLEDDNEVEELAMPDLPDFIRNANIKADNSSKNTSAEIEEENNDLNINLETEATDTDNTLEINSEALDTQDYLDTNTSLSPLESENDVKDFSAEIDDITMSLVSITSETTEVFDHTDDYISELERLELLAEISGYNDVAKVSQWCQSNLLCFSQNQDDDNRQFIASSESWAWIELISAALNDPEEISHLSSLSSELMRDAWVEPLDIEILQDLLLALKTSPNKKLEENKEVVTDLIDLETSTNKIIINDDLVNDNMEPESTADASALDENIINQSNDFESEVVIEDNSEDNAENIAENENNNLEENIIKNNAEDDSSIIDATSAKESTENITIKENSIEKLIIENNSSDDGFNNILIEDQLNDQENLEAQLSDEHSTPEIISWDEDIHPELLEVYLQETPDQIAEVASLLHKISKGEANKEDHQVAARIAHTIKGASGVLGITSLVELTHRLEDILDFSVNNELPNETSELLAESSDCLESLFEAIQNKEAIPEEFSPVINKLSKTAELLENGTSNESAADDTINLEKPSLPDFILKKSTNRGTADSEVTPLEDLLTLGQENKKAAPSNEAQIRVPVSVIDKLLNLAGELVITSSQVSDKISSTLETRKSLKDQDKHVHKMLEELSSTIIQQEKDQAHMLSSLKNSAFDTLEMDTYNELHSVVGLLTESILDSETIEESLGQQLTDLNAPIRTLDQLNKELSDVILSSRMVSVNTLVPRLERIIRETCRKTDKKAELTVTGKEINVDTDIINGLVDPLLHLLRNSVDHGIETPEKRTLKNKDETGQITLNFKRQGNFILMQLKDDGMGIDPEMIYQRAIEKELITPDQEFSKQEMLNLILQAGFTTQDSVSDISGRGVGMDVVKNAVELLKGTLEIDSTIGKGTTFSLKIPLTLVTSSTLLVKTANNKVAIPSDTIEQLYYLSQEKVITHDDHDGTHYVLHEDKEILIQSLSQLLGWQGKRIDFEQANTLILVKNNNKMHAIHIDEIIHSREVVIKSLAPWIDSNNGVIGACHLPDGSVAPVLNLPLIIKNHNQRNALDATQGNTTENNQIIEDNSPATIAKVLIVDDSLSNRKALSLIIEQTPYDVVTAVDGLDALNIMNEQEISMVFTDLEMPRMNGLELTQSIRVWENYKNIPVIMITSRTTSKHRQLAEKVGVNGYLTKPVVTETLLESIDQWIESDSSILA